MTTAGAPTRSDPGADPILERLLDANARFAEAFAQGALPAAPRLRLAVVACMDARLDVAAVLGLAPGDAHVIRNAGGLATDDAIRSIVVSQELLGTRAVVVVEHTDCGMLGLDDASVGRRLAERTGTDVDLPLGGFADLEANLRAQVARIRSHPWTRDAPVHGLVYDVATGRLRPVD